MGRTILLIGGTPTAGKSTIAHQLSRQLGLPWISSDQIRDTMRVTARRDEWPDLFTPHDDDADTFFGTFSAEEIVDIEYRQADAAWVGVRAFIERDYTWTDGFIVEGVNVLPHLVHRDLADRDVRAVFLGEPDERRRRHVLAARGLWDDAPDYSDAAKEAEVAWTHRFGTRLRADALAFGYPWLDVSKDGHDGGRVAALLGLAGPSPGAR